MKSIKETLRPQSTIFKKLALGVLLLAIMALFIGGQQGAPRQVQLTPPDQENTVQDILEFDLVNEIGGQQIPVGSRPLINTIGTTLSPTEVVLSDGFSQVKKTDPNSTIHNLERGGFKLDKGETGKLHTGTTLLKPILPIDPYCHLSNGELGGPGNQGVPRAYKDDCVDIGGQQNAPRNIDGRTVSQQLY